MKYKMWIRPAGGIWEDTRCKTILVCTNRGKRIIDFEDIKPSIVNKIYEDSFKELIEYNETINTKE